MPHPPLDQYAPTPLAPELWMVGQERAFRIDAAGPQEDKIYLSFQRPCGKHWAATSLTPAAAAQADSPLQAWLGPDAAGLAQYGRACARAGHPIRLIQAVFPWAGGGCRRLKLYHEGATLPEAARATATRHPHLYHAVEAQGLELSGIVWPIPEGIEIYTRTPDPLACPAQIRAPLEAAGGVLCQSGHDTDGVTTWYFSTASLPFAQALSALEAATGRPTSGAARAHLWAFLRSGWRWGDLIVQSTPAGPLPVAHLIHPRPGGKTLHL